MIKVDQIFTDSPLRNYTYLVHAQEGVYCIDPWEASQVERVLGDKKLLALVNTHEHADHTRGNRRLVERHGCPVWAHSNAKGKIPGVERYLSQGELIPLGGRALLEVMDTPGHTFAHLCLLLREGRRPHAVFTGDTLFNAGVGNCHHGGDPRALYQTISGQFQDLPGEVLLYPGHEYLGNNLGFTLDREPGNKKARQLSQAWAKVDFRREQMVNTMETEREVNTFLRLDNREIVDNLPNRATTPEQVFLSLRELRDRW